MNTNQENKKGVFTGLKTLFTNGSNKIKEKFTGIFNKKDAQNMKQYGQGAPVSPGKVQFKENSNNNDANKKPIFTIEEDEDHKVYNYHLEEDDEDYDLDDHDEIQEETKEGGQHIKSSPVKPVHTPNINNENISQETTATTSTTTENKEPEEEVDYDPYDVYSVCHRIYQKDATIDLDGMTYLKCKRLKTKNKLFSMIGVY
jgi:hypothetical protein